MTRTGADERALWIGVPVAFAPALAGLAGQWMALEPYGHGFLVPLVSAAAAHPRVRRLGPSRRRPGGLAGLAVALVVYGGGLAAGSVALQGLAFVGALAALVGFRWGAAGLRRLAFPLAFLLFMIPLPAAWLTPLIAGLQQAVSTAATEALRVVGVSVLREGNVMVLPGGGRLFVDEACSGITSLVTLVPVGVLIARFTERSPWRRGVVVAAVVPAALLGNFLRVVGTVLAARSVGVERATSGTPHDLAGVATFVFACAAVIGVGWLVRERPVAEASAGGVRP